MYIEATKGKQKPLIPDTTQTARKQVIKLMGDNRERTTNDIARALGKSSTGPTSVTLHRMARRGLLVRDMLSGTAIWRKT